MNNIPITYENKMKDRDNEFLYSKCVKQYHCIMNYQFKMREYKDRIKELEEENERLSKELNTCMIERNNFLSRNEKAIEHIKSHQICYITQYKEESCFDNHLLDILEGEERRRK